MGDTDHRQDERATGGIPDGLRSWRRAGGDPREIQPPLTSAEIRARRRGEQSEDYDPREVAGDEAIGNPAYSGEGSRETGSPEPTTPP